MDNILFGFDLNHHTTLRWIENGTIKDLKLSIILKLLKFFNSIFEFLISGEYHISKLKYQNKSSTIYTHYFYKFMNLMAKQKDQQKIEMIDQSDESAYEFVKIL